MANKNTIDVKDLAGRLKDNLFSRTLALREKEAVEQAIPGVGTTGPHPYQRQWYTFGEELIVFKYAGNGGIPNGTGSATSLGLYAGLFPLYEDVWTPDKDYQLVSRLREEIMGTDFNLSAFLGAEGRDTLTFLGDTATRFNRAISALRKGRLSDGLKHLGHGKRGAARRRSDSQSIAYLNRQKDVYRDLLDALKYDPKRRDLPWSKFTANQWLEVQLAMAPLVGDAQAAAGQLAWITNTQRRLRYSANAQATKHNGEFRWAEASTRVRRGVIVYFTHTPQVINFAGLQDPEVTIWNALPLTFVFDYWLNIGGFLQARANAAAMPAGVYIISTKTDHRCYGPVRVGNSSVVGGFASWYRSGTFSRTINNTLPVPPPRFKPLGAFDSWKRTMTVVALAVASTWRYVSD